MATIWLSDIGTFDEMNGEWDAWVPEGHAPARACVESKLANAAVQGRDPGRRGAVG